MVTCQWSSDWYQNVVSHVCNGTVLSYMLSEYLWCLLVTCKKGNIFNHSSWLIWRNIAKTSIFRRSMSGINRSVVHTNKWMEFFFEFKNIYSNSCIAANDTTEELYEELTVPLYKILITERQAEAHYVSRFRWFNLSVRSKIGINNAITWLLCNNSDS